MEALYVQHREAPVPPIPSSLQVPDEVESVIRKTLEKSPDNRYGSAAELADALERALAGGAPQGPRTEVSPPRAEPPKPHPAAPTPPRPPQAPPPPRQPAASEAGSGRSGGIPSWILFGGLGAVVIGVISIVVAMAVGGSSGGERVAAISSNISYYTKAIQRDPNEAILYNDRGISYHQLGQYQNAIADYTEAIEIDPDEAIFYNNRGVAYRGVGQPTLAASDQTIACSLNSRYC
jgi:tetratricopeptide (TPR) repeat protein